MWPHLMTLALGDLVVVVGTDDDQLATTLAPWVTTNPDIDQSVVDFSAQLHPPPPVHRSGPRLIPVVHHGTVVLARSTDIDELRTALLRVLGSLTADVPEGCVRLTGVPLLRDGAVELASLQTAAEGSRTLRRRGYEPMYSGSVIIDSVALTVNIPPSLGSSASPTVAPLRAWWSDLPNAEPPWPFAQVVAMTTPRIIAMAPDRSLTSSQLAALVALMEYLPPRPSTDVV